MSRPVLLFVAPNSWVVRNWLSTGLADRCASELNVDPVFVSHFEVAELISPSGKRYQNSYVPSGERGKADLPRGFSRLLYFLYYLRLRTFAVDVPEGSIQMMQMSRRKDALNVLARLSGRLFPLTSRRRVLVRALFDRVNPKHGISRDLMRRFRPIAVVTGSPGFQFLDQVVIIEAKRARVPVHCVVSSWDNMTSRGAMIRRPDTLMVWNEFMRDQAQEIHLYPRERTHVVGSLQFAKYRDALTAAEVSAMYSRLGIPEGSPYVLFLTGQHVPEYEAEDVEVFLRHLPKTRFAGMRVVVRVHPQAPREAFAPLEDLGVILDVPPRFSATGEAASHFDSSEMRTMASLLSNSALVVSSWGTTALLEAAIFDKPILQLRWMDAFPRRRPDQAARVHDFQRYMHLVPFDRSGCRKFSDDPDQLSRDVDDLMEREAEFRSNRRRAVEVLATTPLEDAPSRVIAVLRKELSRQ